MTLPNQDRISELYKGEIWSAALQRRARNRIHWLCEQAQGKVLDLGCSQGIASLLLAEAGLSVVGVDLEFDRLQYAMKDREELPSASATRVSFVWGDGECLPFPNDVFDAVLMGELLEHLIKPDLVLGEVRRVLRPGGVVALTTPFGYSPHHDHKRTFYPASAIRLVSEYLNVRSVELEDRYLRVVATSSTQDGGNGELLILELQDQIEREFLRVEQDLEQLHEEIRELREAAGRERAGLKSTIAELREAERAGVRERAGLESTVATLRSRVEKLHRDRIVLQNRLADTRWKLQAMRARRWWQLGRVLGNAWRNLKSLPLLPRDLFRVIFAPTDRPQRPKPEKLGPAFPPQSKVLPANTRSKSNWSERVPHELQESIRIEPLALPEGPVARPDMKVAVILDEFSMTALQYEFIPITFGPDNWRDVLESEKPVFLFVESAWKGNGGSWQGIMTSPEGPRQPLIELVQWCRDRAIPTVFWNKEDPPNFDWFIESAKLFDWVLTVDEDCIPRYRQILGHDRVGVLPFGAQPQIHNPISIPAGRARQVAFAGTYYVHKHPERKEQVEVVLDPAREFELEIFARVHDDDNYRFPEKYLPHIVGSIDYEQMLTAHKLYKVFLNVNSVTESPTMCARRVFELLACGTPVISGYSRAIEELLGRDLVWMAGDKEQTRWFLRSFLQSAELRDRMGVTGVRKVMEEHTYGRRVDQLLELLGIGHQTNEKPCISLVCPTNRVHHLETIFENVNRQRYRPLELVLVAHGLPVASAEIRQRAAQAGIDRIEVVPVDSSLSLGAVLNAGFEAAQGDFVGKIDDDNFYGPHFVTDLAHAFQYTEAGIVGKWSHYTYLESQGCLMVRFPGYEHQYVDLVAGSAMLAARPVVEAIRFPDLGVGEDTAFLRQATADGVRIYSTDRFNYVYVRNIDSDGHTWKVDDAELLSKGTAQVFGRNFDHVVV